MKPMGRRKQPNLFARLVGFGTIAVVVGIVFWGLYFFFGSYWWRVLIFILAVPVCFWAAAKMRDRYTRHVATKFGFSFSPGFPTIPLGSPAHGRIPWGFTGLTLSRKEARATFNVYEQSYRNFERGQTQLAHGMWWQCNDPLYPNFELSQRTVLGLLTSVMVPTAGSAAEEIVFPDDPDFSRRFIVHGRATDSIRRLLNPELRRVLLETVDRGTVRVHGVVLAWDRPGRMWGRSRLGRLIPRADRLRQACETAARLAR